VDQISIFFHCKIQKGSAGKVGIKTTISSQICCCTTLWKASGQQSNKSGSLYSTVNSVQSDENVFITVNVQEECHFFVFLHRLISITCLKCPPLAHMCVLSRECCQRQRMCQLKGSLKEPNMFHIYETEKITLKASDVAEYIELFGSFTGDRHARCT